MYGNLFTSVLNHEYVGGRLWRSVPDSNNSEPSTQYYFATQLSCILKDILHRTAISASVFDYNNPYHSPRRSQHSSGSNRGNLEDLHILLQLEK